DPDLEELWHEARSQISLLATRSHVRRRVQLEDTYDRLLRTGERFSTNLELSSLSEALREELPVAQVRNAFVALYGPEGCGTLDPLFCLVDGESRAMLPEAYPTAEIFPPQTFSTRRRTTWVLLPLTFEAERLGVVGFEYTTSVVAYSMFRDRISAALKTADMHQEIVIQTAAHERNRQERLATAERIKSLSLLAGGVAHDLNNALGPLAALPDVLVHEIDRLADWDSPAKREIVADLGLIKSAAQRAAQTIKDLLTLGRQHQVKKETLDLNRVAAACASGALDRPDRIELVLELGPEPLWVNASDSHVSRAITNLLRNAAEAIPERGQITLKTWGEYLGSVFSGYELVEPGEYAVLSVRDSGQGIAPEVLKRIFEPFFSSKKLRDGSGSGLGLAIVHGVVKEHGGYINVMSRPGLGTEFTLYFPKAPSAPKALAEPAILPGKGRGKLLVLDDDPMQLRTAKRILSHAGYDVVTADSGQRALALLRESDSSPEAAEPSGRGSASPFDLVLLDMNLNEAEDGLEIFERMRSTYPNQRGILVSGHAPLERGELAQHRGLTWLSKPYTSDALLLAVQTVLLQVSPSYRPLWHPSDIEQRHLSFGPPESQSGVH
ncbi:MAG TPA: ATP-binding protein, partial [Polyangiaceae bacterium]|nr:ATP-binding protein [Polyangiaceae bacterium]